jgi:hypothetical protein
MTSTASTSSLASQIKKLPALYMLSYFPGIRNLSSLHDLNSLTGLNDLKSLISSNELLSLMLPSTLAQKMNYPCLSMWDQNSTFLLIFGNLSVGVCGGQRCYF